MASPPPISQASPPTAPSPCPPSAAAAAPPPRAPPHRLRHRPDHHPHRQRLQPGPARRCQQPRRQLHQLPSYCLHRSAGAVRHSAHLCAAIPHCLQRHCLHHRRVRRACCVQRAAASQLRTHRAGAAHVVRDTRLRAAVAVRPCGAGVSARRRAEGGAGERRHG